MRLPAMTGRLMLGAAAAIVAVPLAFAQAEVIAERKDGFKAMEQNLETIQRILQTRQPVPGAVAPARAIAEHAPRIKTLFPAGSDRGDTRAMPTIWSDRAGFERAAGAFETQAQALLAAAEGGDARTLGSALEATGQACVACHRPYRQRR